MAEQIDIDINVNMDNVDAVDELTNKLQEATSEVERLQEEISFSEEFGFVNDIEDLETELAAAESEAESLQSQLDEMSNTTIDPEVKIDDSGIDETNEKLQETESSASSLTTSLAGIAGVIGVEQMVATADRINTSWNQLNLTFGGTGVSMDELKTKSSQVADATGRSGGQIRGYFNSMGIAGITNTTLLSNSFESLAGRSYQTGRSIESMQGSLQKMVMSGNAGQRQLQNLGITTEDLATAMGVSADEAKEAFEALTPDQRLEALTKAMGDGTAANEMYKNSYEGLKTQAETAMAGLMGAIGQGILPVINPMIQQATGFVKSFTSSFKGLPGPVQAVVGGFGGFVAAGTAVIGTLGLVGQVGSGVVGGLRSMKSGYDTVRGAMSTAKVALDALRNAESITQGIRAALAVVTGAETAAEGANAAAKTAATGPTTGLAIAENALLWPLLLIVGAVIAVVAVMWYLYNTNETVRNGINWLTSQIQAFVGMLIPAAQGILRFVTTAVSNIGRLPGMVWNIFLRVVSFVGQWAANMVSRGLQAAHNFVNQVAGVFGGIVGRITSALSGVVNAITKPFRDAWNYVKPYVDKIQQGLDFINPFSGFEGFGDFGGYSGGDTLNNTLATIATSSSTSSMTVNNNFNGIIEESAADYIVGAVNDRLRREKLLKGG